MRRTIAENRVFFTCFICYFLLGGLLLLSIEHGDSILFFSDQRNAWTDAFFRYWTHLSEVPMYGLLALILLFIRIRHSLFTITVGIGAAVISLGAKAFFARNRPVSFFQEIDLFDRITLVDGYGLSELYTGATSFPSGHTLSAFALYGYLAFIAPRKGWFGAFLFHVALLVGLSRIYLVQHFLEDVYVGALLGTLLAMGIYGTQQRIPSEPQRWWEGRLMGRGKR